MRVSEIELEKKAKDVIRSCLKDIQFIKIDSFKRGTPKEKISPDLQVDLKITGQEKQTLFLEVKNNGQPRYAREAVNQLLRYMQSLPDSYGVFVAPYISEKAGEICLNENIGYIDFSGNCRLCFKKVYIEIKGNPNLYAQKRDLRSLYSPKGERLLRVLLSNPKKFWKIQELSDEADVSLGQTSNIKKLLNNREWLSITKEGLKLNYPENLLKEWAENYSYQKNTIQNYYSMDNIADIENSVADVCSQQKIKYALTGFSGAARLAPNVRYKRVMVYMEKISGKLLSSIKLKSVSSGANVSILFPYDNSMFYGTQVIDGMQIVSPIQIYLDLKSYRGRGEEAAESVFEEVIKLQW